MASRTRAADRTATRVYHSSPAPTQVHFPARRRLVRSYGRQPPSSASSLRQQTLTQIDYIRPFTPQVMLRDDDDESPPQKRRRTMGDLPRSSAGSFHTQTLTQLLNERGESREGEDEGEVLVVEDSDVELETPPRPKDWRELDVVPQTPTRQLGKSTEVPCSEGEFSPLLRDQTLPDARSPLLERSANVVDSSPVVSGDQEGIKCGRQKRVPTLVVQDSCASADEVVADSSLTTPQGKNAQGAVLISLPVSQASGREIPRAIATDLGSAKKSKAAVEIPDSDDELESLGPSPEKEASQALPELMSGTPTPVRTHFHRPDAKSNVSMVAGKDVDEERSSSMSRSRPSTSCSETPHAHTRSSFTSPPKSSLTPKPRPDKTRQNDGEHTSPKPVPEVSSPPTAQSIRTQPKSQYYTQGFESQRVPLAVLTSMAPTTARSDIILSIYPEPAAQIEAGTKTYEYRSYQLPATASRAWIYVTAPVRELRYMATLGPALRPGEIPERDGDARIARFNAAETGFAHELTQVYLLNNPVPLEVMRENGWLGRGGPPQRYTYVPPAVVGQLLGNLRCALFEDEDEDGHGERAEDPSISQELEEQLKSDISYSTQLPRPMAAPAPAEDLNVVPSSSMPAAARLNDELTGKASTDDALFARPSLPVARSHSQSQRPPFTPHASGSANSMIRHSQATTASEPSTPTATYPEKSSIPRPQAWSSGPKFLEDVEEGEESLAGLNLPQGEGGFSMESSQSGLHDSLLRDEGRMAPVVIWDSEDEDEGDEVE